MRILFTGGSSFSGSWFVRKLCDAGHQVTVILSQPRIEDYTGLSKQRVAMIRDDVDALYDCRFGSKKMLDFLQSNPVDLLCMHGAQVGNHRASGFSVMGALHANTHNLAEILDAASAELKHVVYSGSYFEPDVGQGTLPLRAFSPYALSKALTWSVLRFECERQSLPVAKFVMPNPFGVYEKPNLTSYLAKSWLSGEVPLIATPDYVRDNIPVNLLATAFCNFCQRLVSGIETRPHFEPSGYCGSQGAFVQRFSTELGRRWGRTLEYTLAAQEDFGEPLERVNRHSIFADSQDWDESSFWDGLSDWYKCGRCF